VKRACSWLGCRRCAWKRSLLVDLVCWAFCCCGVAALLLLLGSAAIAKSVFVRPRSFHSRPRRRSPCSSVLPPVVPAAGAVARSAAAVVLLLLLLSLRGDFTENLLW
jgi:hypothetical protein